MELVTLILVLLISGIMGWRIMGSLDDFLNEYGLLQYSMPEDESIEDDGACDESVLPGSASGEAKKKRMNR